jgi:hypothetical protein
MQRAEMGAEKVAIVPGWGENPNSDQYGVFRETVAELYGEGNVHPIEIDWRGGTYPAWREQAITDISRQCGPKPDIVAYSLGALVVLGLPVNRLALLSPSPWAGPQARELERTYPGIMSPEQAKALAELEVDEMARTSPASQVDIFYGEKELQSLKDMSIGLGKSMSKAGMRVTVHSVRNATHPQALEATYLHEVKAVWTR